MDRFCLIVVTFDAAEIGAHLRSYGIEPGIIVNRYSAGGTGPSLYLRDPNGNTVELKSPSVSMEIPNDI